MTNLQKILQSDDCQEIVKIEVDATQEKIQQIMSALNPMNRDDLPFVLNALEVIASGLRRSHPEAALVIDKIKSFTKEDTTIITVELPPKKGGYKQYE